MPVLSVSIPDKYHKEGVTYREVGALYVEMLVRLNRKPKIVTIACERAGGTLGTTTVVYKHPDTGDVLLQFTVRHD